MIRVMWEKFKAWAASAWNSFSGREKIMAAIIAGLAIGWAANVYTHWEPIVVRNYKIGKLFNHMAHDNFHRILRLSATIDSKTAREIDTIARSYPRVMSVAELLERLEAVNNDTTRRRVAAPPNIIDSIFAMNIGRDRMTIRVLSKVKNQAHAEFGTASGKYTGEGLRERSFNYNNHHLQIGNNPKYPLTPNTTYFIRVVSTDQQGRTYYSKEITAKTLP